MTLRVPPGAGEILSRITRTIKLGRPHHAYLIVAPSLHDGTQISLWMAAALNCTTNPGTPCGSCSSCRRFIHGTHPDLLDLEPDGRFIKVAGVRELVAQLSYQRHDARYRVARILGAEHLRVEAANALLKSLEEPPEGTVFEVVTAKEPALLSTIRSRCQKLRLGPVPEAVLARWLVDEHGVPEAEALHRARVAAGSTERALAATPDYLEQRRERLLQVLAAWRSPEPARLKLAAELAADKDEVQELARDLYSLCRDAWAIRTGRDISLVDPEAARTIDQAFPGARLERVSDLLERFDDLMLRNVQTRSIVETLLLLDASGAH